MKNGVFWDIKPCGSCKNRRFGGTWRLVAACVVPSSQILVTLMKEAPGSPKHRFLQELHGVISQKTPFFTARVFPSSPILVTLMKEGLSSSETRFLQEPHCITFQKTPFFNFTWVHEKLWLTDYIGRASVMNSLHRLRRWRHDFESHSRHECLYVLAFTKFQLHLKFCR
jgi:hypothetical protein